MKKISAILLCLVMILSMASCTSASKSNSDNQTIETMELDREKNARILSVNLDYPTDNEKIQNIVYWLAEEDVGNIKELVPYIANDYSYEIKITNEAGTNYILNLSPSLTITSLKNADTGEVLISSTY